MSAKSTRVKSITSGSGSFVVTVSPVIVTDMSRSTR